MDSLDNEQDVTTPKKIRRTQTIASLKDYEHIGTEFEEHNWNRTGAIAFRNLRVPTAKGLIGVTRSGFFSSDQAEIRLMELHQAGALESNSEFVELFLALSSETVPRVRAALDAGLVFSRRGKHVDLRSLVFGLNDVERQCVVEHIHDSCTRPAERTKGFVVLSDVDDTVLPGHDPLKVAGSDRSWALDGRLYPGVAQLHVELRGNLGRDRDYPVLLTARPPALVRKLPLKLENITDQERPRMSILPGEGGINVPMNFLRILTSNYAALGTAKVNRMMEYALLFPDYTGRFVFIGDDGQADAEAALEMLSLNGPRLQGCESEKYVQENEPLFAFVAIHAVRNNRHVYNVPETERKAKTAATRKQYPALLPGKHRFFYFVDYVDLALQLATAGWLDPNQSEHVFKAAEADDELPCNVM